MPAQSPQANKGFTLVELMITLAVGLIMMLVGIPLFTATTQSNRVASASNALVAHLNLARNEAVKRGVPVAVCATTDQDLDDGADCEELIDWNVDDDVKIVTLVVFIDGDGDEEVDPPERLRVTELPKYVTLSSPEFIRYLADGTLDP